MYSLLLSLIIIVSLESAHKITQDVHFYGCQATGEQAVAEIEAAVSARSEFFGFQKH